MIQKIKEAWEQWNPREFFWYAWYIVVLGMVIAVPLITMWSRPEPKKSEVQQEFVPIPTADVLDAVFRAHRGITKVCFDQWAQESRSFYTARFFILYPELAEGVAEGEQKYMHGWYLLSIPQNEFISASNKSLYIIDYTVDKYTVIFPNIEDLTCMEQEQKQ